MVVEINASSATQAYREGLYKIQAHGKMEDSRAGKVLTTQEPTVLTLYDPTQRVILDPTRNANPFFHAMEFVWMMAGSNEVHWISQFNRRMVEFADAGRINGAYGARWLSGNQIQKVISRLKHNPTTRQAVLSMWDPAQDCQDGYSDYPCNTHIYFRYVNDSLDMTVCNRSNDLVWGMTGANIVHMTMLHELVASATGLQIGIYRVFTNNLHIYERHWPLIETRTSVLDPPETEYFPILGGLEEYHQFRRDCVNFLEDGEADTYCYWMTHVAYPIYSAWQHYKRGNPERCFSTISEIEAEDWRIACQQWISRKYLSSAEAARSSGTTQSPSL